MSKSVLKDHSFSNLVLAHGQLLVQLIDKYQSICLLKAELLLKLEKL
jgi:hypothetical protein